MKKQLLQAKFTSNLFTLLITIWLVVFYACQNNAYAHKFEHPKTWNDPAITKILKTSNVVDIKPMKEALIEQGKKAEFDGQVFLITLEHGIKAVFKSLPLDDQGDAGAEVAAYQASVILGFPYIPPTVLREIRDLKGSLQLFVNTPIDLLVNGIRWPNLSRLKNQNLEI